MASLVQIIGTKNGGAPTLTTTNPYTITVPAGGVALGNKIIVWGATNGTTSALTGVTDSRGNTYTVRMTGAGANSGIFLADATVSTALQSGDVITITRASNANSYAIALEYNGLGAFDTQAVGTWSGSTAGTGGAINTAESGELLLGLFRATSTGASNSHVEITTPGSGYSNQTGVFTNGSSGGPTTGFGLDWESKTGGAAGSETATATMNITPSGSGVGATVAYKASITNSDSPSGTIALTGSRTESYSRGYEDAPSGSIPATGTRTESRSASDARSGSIGFSGSIVESYARTFTDARSGTIPLSGSIAEQFNLDITYTDARSGTLPLTGSLTRSGSQSSSDSPSGSIGLTGSRSESWSVLNPDTPVGTLSIVGSLWDEFDGPGLVANWGLSVRERPPLRLHAEVETPGGRFYRWAGDEPQPENVPSNLRFSSIMPGGHESLDCTLPRKPGVNYPDLERFSTVRIHGAGGDTAWEGRLERSPQVSGDQMSISPSAVGWQAHLDDNKNVCIIFIDRDLNRWRAMGKDREQSLLASNFGKPFSHDITPAPNGGSILTLAIVGAWGANARPICEPVYDAGPSAKIGRLRGTWTRQPGVSAADANWTWSASLGAADTAAEWSSASPTTGNLRATGPGTIDLVADIGDERYATLLMWYGALTAAGTDNVAFGIDWTDLRVFGDHGLTLAGSGAEEGVYAYEAIRYAVTQWAPMLVVTDESISASGMIVPQLVFDSVTTSEIVRQTNRFELRDWAVWDKKVFWLHDRGARGRKWRARIAPAQLEETGLQADQLWESIVVQYQDVDGSTRTVGPTGSGADTESSYLKDSDPENPANKLGMTRRDKLVMGIGTAASAIEVGRRFLDEQKLLDHSGRARLVGHVTDDRGVLHPYWRVRAGDQISFVDAADTSYRRIVRADHDDSSRSASVDLDAPPEGLQALLERLGVVLAPLGL